MLGPELVRAVGVRLERGERFQRLRRQFFGAFLEVESKLRVGRVPVVQGEKPLQRFLESAEIEVSASLLVFGLIGLALGAGTPDQFQGLRGLTGEQCGLRFVGPGCVGAGLQVG